ncbi:heavy metal translocating P-type ATPase [Pedobacter panaciterrae]|jgi:ATPase, P-type (transporting), HAD superfamily, subfamily IC|uniref:heavy metal translocating P-type ATPase n=1 Tax=Pedobacter panaciterrae TaxID=363849 RepID=UPI00155DC36B|nr:heavy metal translocating P-type ATPase metal-binding domain-containing protein [Pedobacter panaciterrae]NQX55879.1 heavy metal translocating P-type ATPase metal-binding domain-containing protein [Pedobacter panaciterrae]
MLKENVISSEKHCFHCGDDIIAQQYIQNNKRFCCSGCKTIYEILTAHNLSNYYVYNKIPGKTQSKATSNFDYLEVPQVVSKLVDFEDEIKTIVTLYIPAIHCSSCIWLLEHLHLLQSGILQSRVDFLKKQVSITFKNDETNLKQLAQLLSSIGYEPLISLQDIVKKGQSSKTERSLITKIAVAGFCFGNVMLLSFPDYFGLGDFEREFKNFFGWLNLAFSLPVVLYSGREYFISAWTNLKAKRLNLDFPLALGILVMFLRSAYEIISQTGAGFVDTLCGLVFFLLVGKWMQERTFHHISFERDYRSYFPVAVTTINEGVERPIPLSDLKTGDRILIRSQEILPADAILLNGEAEIDFSFVTGESIPVKKTLGEIIYAGGRQLSGSIEMEVLKPVSQSYLTQLWNNSAFIESKKRIKTFSDTASRYFSIVLLVIALGAGIFWISTDPSKALASFTAVLIIACPCALALSSPFTLAAVLSVFDKNRFYLKNTAVVEELARINTYVFDKTGTITNPNAAGLQFNGTIIDAQMQLISDLARNSGHLLSRELTKFINKPAIYSVQEYTEKIGRGISGKVNGNDVKLGSSTFLNLPLKSSSEGSAVHVMINNVYVGFFTIRQQWRNGFKELMFKLNTQADLHLLSGDHNHEKKQLIPFFQDSSKLHFEQSPQDKLDYIQQLQKEGKKVLMFGDGLNDSGALKQSDLGVAITDNINNFSPGCDAILDGLSFHKIPQFIQQAKDAVKVIRMSFVISLMYNTAGLYFAVQGLLSPLMAAILMPLSTITIILFTSLAVRLFAHKNKLL